MTRLARHIVRTLNTTLNDSSRFIDVTPLLHVLTSTDSWERDSIEKKPIGKVCWHTCLQKLFIYLDGHRCERTDFLPENSLLDYYADDPESGCPVAEQWAVVPPGISFSRGGY